MLPAALSTGIGSQVQRPLAAVVVGGMLIGPVLLLLIVPPLRMLFLGEESISKAEKEQLGPISPIRPITPNPLLGGRRVNIAAKTLCCIGAFSLLLLVSGCAVGPDFQSPKPPSVDGYAPKPLAATALAPNVPGGEEQRFVKDMEIPQQWWTLFESPQLNALIEKSIKANPTLDAAKAALRQAREYVAAQKGFYYPTVQANG